MGTITWGADVAGGVPFSGNVSLSGCRLIGAGGADDALALDWSRNPGTDCAALWRFDEAAYVAQGVDYEVLDSVTGTTNQGMAMIGANTVASGMSRCVQTNGAAGDYVRWPYHTIFQHTGSGAVAMWAYCDGATYTQQIWCRTNSSTTWGIVLQTLADGRVLLAMVRGGVQRNLNSTDTLAAGWNYLVGRWDAAKQYLDLYTSVGSYHYEMASSGAVRRGSGWTTLGQAVAGTATDSLRTDELALWNVEKPQATFDALGYWYPSSGTGTLTGTGLAAKVPSAVSWNATEGASYGEVSKVELLDASLGWTQVGGDNPTSPISVSGITLAADQCLRVTLTPKADAIRSETPILQDVTVTYPDAATGKPWLPTVLSSGRYA